MDQRIVSYVHQKTKSFFVSVMNNNDRFEYESSVARQYQHAQALYRQLLQKNDVPELRSGWMFALINTDFSGWERYINEEVYPTIAAAKLAREETIDYWGEFHTFIGSDHTYAKGVYGQGTSTPKNWTVKFDVTKMTKNKVLDKIRMVTAAMSDPLAPSVINDCYMAIVCPDTNGPRNKNFGSYEVNSLSTLFRFIRQSIGKDTINA